MKETIDLVNIFRELKEKENLNLEEVNSKKIYNKFSDMLKYFAFCSYAGEYYRFEMQKYNLDDISETHFRAYNNLCENITIIEMEIPYVLENSQNKEQEELVLNYFDKVIDKINNLKAILYNEIFDANFNEEDFVNNLMGEFDIDSVLNFYKENKRSETDKRIAENFLNIIIKIQKNELRYKDVLSREDIVDFDEKLINYSEEFFNQFIKKEKTINSLTRKIYFYDYKK